jgi:hypothetical protein
MKIFGINKVSFVLLLFFSYCFLCKTSDIFATIVIKGLMNPTSYDPWTRPSKGQVLLQYGLLPSEFESINNIEAITSKLIKTCNTKSRVLQSQNHTGIIYILQIYTDPNGLVVPHLSCPNKLTNG